MYVQCYDILEGEVRHVAVDVRDEHGVINLRPNLHEAEHSVTTVVCNNTGAAFNYIWYSC